MEGCRKKELENLSAESTLAARRETESRSEMPMLMRKRTAAVVTELDERTKTKKPRMVVDKHDDAVEVRASAAKDPIAHLMMRARTRGVLVSDWLTWFGLCCCGHRR